MYCLISLGYEERNAKSIIDCSDEQEELKKEVKERKKKKEEEHKTIGLAMRNAGSEVLLFEADYAAFGFIKHNTHFKIL